MLRRSIKLLYKFYLSQSLIPITDKTTFALLLIYELQYASIFISDPNMTSPFDSPIINVISITNLQGILGSRPTTDRTILIFFTALFATLTLLKVLWIIRYVKGQVLGKKAQKISTVIFLIQKYILMIPALMLAVKHLLTNSSADSQILGGIVIFLVCGFNLFRAKSRITLPYTKVSYSNTTAGEEGLSIVMILIALFLMRMQTNGSFSKGSVLAFSIVYLIINLVSITKSIILPQLRDPKYQRLHALLQFLAFYTLITHILAQYSISSRFPTLIIVAFLAKIFMNGRRIILDILYRSLKNSSSKISKSLKNLALESLFSEFMAVDKPNYEMIRVVETILENSSRQDIFENSTPTDTLEYPLNTYLKPNLLKFIEEQYVSLIATTNLSDSFQIRLSQIQFLAVACQNPMKAVLSLCETKKVLNGMLSTEQQATLELLQENFQTDLETEVSLNEILKIHETYENLLKRTENLVKLRAQIFSKLAEPACDLPAIKSLGIRLATEADKIVKEMKKQIKEDCTHLKTLHLYEYIKTCLYETPVEFEVSMFQEALIKSRNLLQSENESPDRKVFANLDADSSALYMAFSLDRKKFGQGVACSSNAQKILGASEDRPFSSFTIDDIFPKVIAQSLRDLMMNLIGPSSSLHKDLWCKIWIYQADGSITEARAFISVDLLFQTDLSVVFYVFPSNDSTNYVLCDDDSHNLMGLSRNLLEYIRRYTNRHEMNLLPQLTNSISIQDIIPNFKTVTSSKTGGFEFDGRIQFDKILSLVNKLMDTGQIIKSELTRVAKFAVIINQADALNVKYCKITITQVEEHVNKCSVASTRLPAISYDRAASTLNLPVVEGPSKVNPIEIDQNALDTPKAVDKSEGSIQDAKLLVDRPNGKDLKSETSQDFAIKEKEMIFDRNSSQVSSSRMSNRRRRMKQLINKLDVPNFLMIVNVMGHLSVLGLVIQAIASSVMINEGYTRFSKFATVAAFPTSFTTSVRSIYSTTESVVSINKNFNPPDIAAQIIPTLAANYVSKITRFMTAFNAYMVDFDVTSISPNFKWSDYYMNITWEGVYDTPTALSIYEVSRILIGVTWKLIQTNFAQITGSLPETIWFREYVDGLLTTYGAMRTTLFSDFYLQYNDIIHQFDIILGIGIAVTITLVLAFVFVIRAIEKRKFELMKQLMTIPTSLIDSNLKKLQVEYESYFGVKLSGLDAGIQSLAPDKAKKKSDSSGRQNSTNKRKIIKTNETPLLSILLWMLIPVTYVLSYYATANVYFKYKTSHTIPFIENIDLQSRVAHFPGYSTGLINELMNTYDSPANETKMALALQILNENKEIDTEIIEMMQNINETLLSNSEANDQIKQRYSNISGIGVCNDIITLPDYPICLTAFNGAATFGFGSMFDKLYQYIASVHYQFLANPTLNTILEIMDSPLVNDRIASSLEIDSTMITNMADTGSNLSAIIATLQWTLTVFLVLGIVQMSSLLFFIWRPIHRRITNQYLDCRRVLAILPIDMIVDNKNILYALKKQNNTQFGY